MSARESWKRRERVAKACWREPSIPNSRFPSIGRGRSRKMLCQVVLLAATCYGLAALVAAGQTGTANTWPQEGPVQHRTQGKKLVSATPDARARAGLMQSRVRARASLADAVFLSLAGRVLPNRIRGANFGSSLLSRNANFL